MIITFIRHSATIFQPDIPNVLWQLSDEGINSAEKLSNKDFIKNIDVLYTSLQTKAIQTAVILAKDNHTPIKTDNRLTEVTSITNKFIKNFEEALEKFYNGEIERINDGETKGEAIYRFSTALEEIISQESSKNVGIVSHGNILSLFASLHYNIKAYDIHQNIRMPDVAVFDWDTKKFISFFGEVND